MDTRARLVPEMKRCADFDVLAPIIELDASLLRRDSPADAFIVAMALAYNDYKDVNWMLER